MNDPLATAPPTDPDHPLVRELAQLDLRQNIDLLIHEARSPASPLEPLLAWIAARDPALLADLCCGPRSPGGPALCRAALSQIAPLERLLTPRGALCRLADIAGEADRDVLLAAARRHPEAPWLIGLSRKIEGEAAGAIHLSATAGHPAFLSVCLAHAQSGHHAGLRDAALALGHPAPLAALLCADLPGGNLSAALPAIARFIERWPEVPLLPWLAEQWGPDVEALTRRLPANRAGGGDTGAGIQSGAAGLIRKC